LLLLASSVAFTIFVLSVYIRIKPAIYLSFNASSVQVCTSWSMSKAPLAPSSSQIDDDEFIS
jgi:hypothetical protein